MQTVTAQFLAALKAPHVLAKRVDAFAGSTLLMGRVPFTEGSVSADRGNKIRRSLSLTVSDIALMPRDAGDPLSVYGNTLQVYRGIQYPDGTEEVVPVGVFQIQSADGDRDLGPVRITGRSLEGVVADDPFVTPTASTGLGACASVITTLITQTLPDAVVVNEATNNPSPATRVWDSDDNRWDAIEELASAMGAEVATDGAGVFRIRDLPDLSTATPVWDVTAGPGGVLVSATTGMTRDKVRNGWLVTGGNAADGAAPVGALVVDSDPTSPTRWGGPMGHVLGKRQSNLWVSSGQCTVIGESLLRDSLGVTASVALKAVPNAALEPGDCIRVVYADGYAELHIVQSINVPLTASGDFSLTTYSREET
ncbi:DUF5047 domain-containing protein [Embleya sp. NPDC005971]|uniref:DUF5047 domain-containing protein n=1 Tax=Embleya sp. NPDC005971 TaxID=3156724 RepID=UPI0033FEA715